MASDAPLSEPPELLAAARPGLTPAEIDGALWNRGGAPRCKSILRPRSRSTAYWNG